jgi:hypothetical protein
MEKREMARAKTLDHLALVHGEEMPIELLAIGLAEFVLIIYASAVIAEKEMTGMIKARSTAVSTE